MKVTVFLLINLLGVIKCSRILVLFPTPARSHYILGNALARGLAEAGHDVTLISPFEDKNPPRNGKYRELILTGAVEEHEKHLAQMKMNLVEMGNIHPLLTIFFLNDFGKGMTRTTMEHPNFQKLIKSDEQFDAVIMEQFLNDAMKALADFYKAPLILFSTMGATVWVNSFVGNPSPPSYIPEMFLDYTSHMSFWQRLFNSLFSGIMQLNYNYFFIPAQNKIMKEHFPDAPDLSILNYNVSLLLLNSHESISQPVPQVPSMVEIGGFHINSSKELPKDLKDFLDSAKEGVVYFSMGSNVKPSQMPDDIKEAILKALGKIKQKVLWKWNEDTLPGKPDNVKLSKWFPQQEILAHPNTKLFITHGGLLSTAETVYHGVPILAFPVFGDQKINAARAETNGIGIMLTLSEITEEKLSNALDKLLNDPKYRDAVKIRSNLLHDRPVKPLDLAVYWIEFVIRHRGAPHLRVAALDLPLYQYLLLDVIAFITLISGSSLVITYVVIKRIFCTTKVSTIKLKKN